MRVAVKHKRHRITADWLFQTTRSDERIDLERLTRDGLLDRRVVKKRDQSSRPQSRQRGFELERLGDRFVHEVLDHRLTPGAERMSTEPSAESFDPGDADPEQLAGVAVENDCARVAQDLTHLVL